MNSLKRVKVISALSLVLSFGFAGTCFSYQISDVNLSKKANQVRVSIITSDRPQYKYFKLTGPSRLAIDFLNAETNLKDRGGIEGSVLTSVRFLERQVEPAKITSVILDLKEMTPYQVSTNDNEVLILLADSVKEEPKEVAATKEKTQKTEIPQALAKEKEKVAEIKEVEIAKEPLISLDVRNADLIDVLRLIAHKVDLNIVPNKDVKGSISLRIEDVPWGVALESILSSQGYTYLIKDDVIKVMALEEEEAGLINKVYLLVFADAEEASKYTKSLLTSKGKVEIDKRTNSLVVTDHPAAHQRIEELLAKIDARTPQVEITAKMVEVSLTDEEKWGIEWSALNTKNSDHYEGAGLPKNPMGESEPYFKIGRLINSKYNLDAIMSFINNTGRTNILSSPRIIVLDNEEAKLNVGEELPYLTIEEEAAAEGEVKGKETITVKYKNVGIILTVKPKINSDKFITLKLKPEVSALKEWRTIPTIGDVPVIATRNAETHVLIRDGETIIIGGLMKDNLVSSQSKLPLLGDLPLVGRLFKSSADIGSKTELLIFVSARIIKHEEEE